MVCQASPQFEHQLLLLFNKETFFMNKERLSELLNMLAMGRRDSVEELVDMLTGKAPAKPVPAPEPAPATKPKSRFL